jgi:hypothetical protein
MTVKRNPNNRSPGDFPLAIRAGSGGSSSMKTTRGSKASKTVKNPETGKRHKKIGAGTKAINKKQAELQTKKRLLQQQINKLSIQKKKLKEKK